MISAVRNLPIKQKLLLIVFASTFSALFLASIFLIIIELADFQLKMKEDLTAIARMIGNRSTAALIFDDRKVAQENLSILTEFGFTDQACIYDSEGQVFAHISSKQILHDCPRISTINDPNSSFTQMQIVQNIESDKETIGMLFLKMDLTNAYIRKFKFLGIINLLMFFSAGLTFLLTNPLLKIIASPIAELVNTFKSVSSLREYSVRAKKVNEDELGVLVDSFNTMLATVEIQHKALIEAKNRYLTLYDDNPTMVFNVDRNGKIVSVNKLGALQLSHTTNRMQGYSIYDFVYKDDLTLIKELFEKCITHAKKVHKLEIRMVCSNAQMIWVRGTCRLTKHEDHKSNLLLVCEDVTEARVLTERITYQATHDTLTGLLNRNEFDRQIQLALESARNTRKEYALCYLDLDQFKVVNDTCGHMAGDELLRQLGTLLKNHIRQDDLLARLGGDEFGVLMNGCLLTQAQKACEKMRNAIQDFKFAWEDRTFSVGVSIGIAGINSISGNSIESLKEADAACYAAKEKGRNRVHVFRPNDEELAMRQGEMQWVEKIQQGIDQDKFCLFGQPIVPILADEEGLHFETLVRYKDDSGHLIPPGAFLPAAERYNLAAALDKWVIGTMFEWLAKRPGFLDDLAVCSINLSGLSLSDKEMLAFINEQFSRWQIPSQKICFEITETAAIASLSNATQFIKSLKERGCYFSLDDFGSGLSSFAYLKNLPVDYLKIDGLFVKDILEDKVDLAMVNSINEVGHVMDKKTIAEFVENEEIYQLLKKIGVDYAQGYGIGKPVPLKDLKLVKPFQ